MEETKIEKKEEEIKTINKINFSDQLIFLTYALQDVNPGSTNICYDGIVGLVAHVSRALVDVTVEVRQDLPLFELILTLATGQYLYKRVHHFRMIPGVYKISFEECRCIEGVEIGIRPASELPTSERKVVYTILPVPVKELPPWHSEAGDQFKKDVIELIGPIKSAPIDIPVRRPPRLSMRQSAKTFL